MVVAQRLQIKVQPTRLVGARSRLVLHEHTAVFHGRVVVLHASASDDAAEQPSFLVSLTRAEARTLDRYSAAVGGEIERLP